ncbi:TetR/AcrR family transcriptional regulator [Butyrivibrio sp. CB08]|uniref:TetR/AcrR family transcriptional regulator n=1 Tax=Butyrivibrio sp. CB08 TaxID=2364879 RepID=UPI000EAA7E26|nr:TetR/AcrR family transcriptional regulator [Butyrivibrio sp. CB08]RKM56763.1 TetR/AcrR family transcriptional regulator [Butyrivibrio sp. CB08]
MPKIFTDENRDEIRKKLLDKGFKMLKKGGLSAVNIDKLTEETYIAKGTFYNLFENKSEFMYHMMIHERNRAKEKLLSYLNDSGKLTKDSLRDYLKWLSAENPNVFTFLTDAEKKRLIASWSDKYIEDKSNDSKTMHMLISLLESPATEPDWKLACNYMKLIAISLATKKVFIKENYNVMVDSLIEQILNMLCS